MKILSLGANGAVGQIALDDLLKANHDVTALLRNAASMSFTNRSRRERCRSSPICASGVQWRLRITRAGVAAFLVEQVVKDHYVRQMPIIIT